MESSGLKYGGALLRIVDHHRMLNLALHNAVFPDQAKMTNPEHLGNGADLRKRRSAKSLSLCILNQTSPCLSEDIVVMAASRSRDGRPHPFRNRPYICD